MPTSIDHVTITSAGYSPVLSTDATISNFTITSGTLNLGGHELTTTGNVSMTGGTVSNGALTQNSTGTTTITGVTVNCVLNVDASNISINTSRFKQETHITKTDGPGNTFSGNVWEGNTSISNFGSGAILTVGYSQPDTFLMDVNLDQQGRSYKLGTSSGPGAIVFAGDDRQNLSINGKVVAYRTTINKPSNALYLTGTLSVYKVLTLTKGVLNDENGLVYIIDATVNGTSDSSYVEGPVEKMGSNAFTFPVGKNGYYRPISISAGSLFITNKFRAEYHTSNSDQTYAHSSKDSGIEEISRNEYWMLERTSGSVDVSVTLGWDTLSTSCSFDDIDSLVVASWDGSQWKNRGNGGTTGNLEAGTVVTNGTSSTYSAYALATTESFSCTNDNLIDGVFPAHTAVPDTNIMTGEPYPLVFDRFGNTYNISDIRHGSCTSDWDTDLPMDVTAGFFNLNFCTQNAYDPFDTDARAVIAQVFEDLSELIVPQVCGTDTPFVNIQITAPPDTAGAFTNGMGNALGAATAFYIPEWEVCTNLANENSGILYGQVWRAINTGVNNPDLMDGQINLNFANFTFNTDNSVATGAGEYDLYTVVLHEVLHCLGFATLMKANGTSFYANNGLNFYSRFDTHLRSGANDVLTLNLGANLYDPAYSGAPLNGLCILDFDGAHSTATDIANWVEGRHSHFSNVCGAGTNQVMLPTLTAAEDRRQLSDEDVNVLLDLGYEITGTFPPNSGATPSGSSAVIGYADGFQQLDPNENCSSRITMELCPSPADHVQITAAQLLTNDINADGIVGLELLTTGNATLTNTGAGTWDFTPTVAGVYVLRYVPVNNPVTQMDINTVGNSTCVRIDVYPCDPLGTCFEPDACNQICNPNFTHLDTAYCDHNAAFTGVSFFMPGVPSWQSSHGSADWFNCTGINPPNPGYAWMFSNCITIGGVCVGQSEGIMTEVNIVQGEKYTVSYFRRQEQLYSSQPMDTLFVRLFDSASSPNIPAALNSHTPPAVPTNSQLIVEEVDINDTIWQQVTACFTADDDYDRIWFYPKVANSNSTIDVLLDRVSLVKDTFSAGIDQIIDCGNATLGEVSCEADNATYSWNILDDATVISTNQQTLVNVNETTSFEVTRSYPTNPATLAIPTVSDNCLLTDTVVVTVTDPIILTIDTDSATCSNCNGNAEITSITNGTSPFSYLWEDDDEETVSIVDAADSICAGVYTITVIDHNGCVAIEEVEIEEGECEGCFPTTGTNSGSWPKHGDCDENGRTHTVLSDEEGNVYVTGYLFSTDSNDPSLTGFGTFTNDTATLYVAKYSADGIADWVRVLGKVGAWVPDMGYDLAIGGDCNLIVTGLYTDTIYLDNITLTGAAAQTFIMKMDSDDGSVLAATNLTDDWNFESVAVSPSTGNIYTMGNDGSVVIRKLNSSLTILTTTSFGSIGTDDVYFSSGDITRGIAVDTADNVYVTVNLTTGYNFGPFPGVLLDDASIAKFDSDLDEAAGILLASFGSVHDITTDASGVSFVVGGTNLRVAELPASLASVSNTYTYNTGATGTSIAMDATHFYFSGMESGTDVIGGKALQSNGSSVFANTFTSDESICNTVSFDTDGNAFIGGAFEDEMVFDNTTLTATYAASLEMFAARLDESSGASFRLAGENENGSFPDSESAAKTSFYSRVYPNPAKDQLFLLFHGIDEEESLRMELVDIAGARVRNQYLQNVQHKRAKMNLAGLAEGVYLLKVTVGAEQVIHRVVLAR